MNNHPVEGQLRDALAAHAETFSASPDGWQHVQAKDARLSRHRRGRSGPPRAGWLARHSAFVIPAAAAAAVAAIALSTTALAHGFSGTTGRGTAAPPATGKWCAGQCGPPYELWVDFRPGTTHAAAQKLLTSCTDHNPVVIRVGPPRDVGGGLTRATIYTQVFGDTPRTAGLFTCLRHSSLTLTASFPD
jgi:hypothetical protein